MTLSNENKQVLMDLARKSIEYGLKHGHAIKVNPRDYHADLQKDQATFVTLEERGQLRGCVGMIEACQPLACDVVNSAYLAAFKDTRFYPVQEKELPDIEIHISLLSPLSKIEFSSQEDLLAKLKPNIDGLIFSEQGRRGAFLPVVWEDLPNPIDFLNHLKLKAGLPMTYWSDTVEVFRFTAERIP